MSEQSSEELLKLSFRKFLWVIWQHIRLPDPTPIQYDIALYIQNGPRRRMIQAFRGVGKSFLTVAYVLWRLYRDPDTKIMVVSASEPFAIEFATFVRRLIEEVEILKHLRPKDGQRDSVLAFDVGPAKADKSPSLKAVGIGGQLAGSRADLIVSDDVEVPKNSATEAMREKLSEQVKEYDAVLKPGGEVIYLGTPQTFHSIYRLVKTRGYDCRIWPARYPKSIEKYEGSLAPIIADAMANDPSCAGRPTEPTRFTDLDLAEREASYGRSGFALQFMLDTSLSDANRFPLRTSDLILFDCDVDVGPLKLTWASGVQQVEPRIGNVGFPSDRLHRPLYISPDITPWEGSILFIDPSGRGSDETAFCVSKLLKGMVYITRWGGLTGGYDETTLEALAMIAKEQKVGRIVVEDNFGDGMFSQLLKPVLARIYPCTIEEDYKVGSTQKEARIIDTLEPALNQHKVVLDYKVAEAQLGVEELKFNGLYQLTHLTRDRGSLRHDDRVDALAQAVAWWADRLAADLRRVEEDHRSSQRKKEFERFRTGILQVTNGCGLDPRTGRPPGSLSGGARRRPSVLRRR
jgi:hypothetical protein